MPEDPTLFDVKLDIFSRSTLSRGVIDQNRDKATRFCRVMRKNGLALTKAQAADVLAQVLGNTHDEVTTLPLQDIQTYSWSETKVYAIAKYGYTGQGWGNAAPTINPFVAVRSYTSYEPMDVYSRYVFAQGYALPGSPSGTLPAQIPTLSLALSTAQLEDSSQRPRPTSIWQRPVLKYVISTVLPTNPHGTVLSRVGRINSDVLSWGGITFPPQTMRFDGLRVDWTATAAGVVSYQVDYYFTAADWWIIQVLLPSAPPVPFWDVFWMLAYDEKPFNSQGFSFPVHV